VQYVKYDNRLLYFTKHFSSKHFSSSAHDKVGYAQVMCSLMYFVYLCTNACDLVLEYMALTKEQKKYLL